MEGKSNLLQVPMHWFQQNKGKQESAKFKIIYWQTIEEKVVLNKK